jgi:dTDP-4-dehydrorhamnose reductase
MKILVTGAHGFLGRSLLDLAGETEWIGCGRSAEPVSVCPYFQIDLQNPDAVTELLDEVRPDWVINTAALTNVDQCEEDRDLARQVNLGPISFLVSACDRVGTGLMQLSTDYVFDGKSGPYTERDEPNPLSHYGRLKLDSERLTLDGSARAIVVRTLWLYGYMPAVHPNFVTWALAALHRRDRLEIFDDQWGNPTYIHDLAQSLLELCCCDARGLFHMGGAAFMTRYDLALELTRFFGLDTNLIKPIATQDAGLKAERPLRSGLNTDALEAELKRSPLSFTEGLEHMVRQENFRRDFPHFS